MNHLDLPDRVVAHRRNLFDARLCFGAALRVGRVVLGATLRVGRACFWGTDFVARRVFLEVTFGVDFA